MDPIDIFVLFVTHATALATGFIVGWYVRKKNSTIIVAT
jgi:hypothetical protein